jgi:hypothetical protein
MEVIWENLKSYVIWTQFEAFLLPRRVPGKTEENQKNPESG